MFILLILSRSLRFTLIENRSGNYLPTEVFVSIVIPDPIRDPGTFSSQWFGRPSR